MEERTAQAILKKASLFGNQPQNPNALPPLPPRRAIPAAPPPVAPRMPAVPSMMQRSRPMFARGLQRGAIGGAVLGGGYLLANKIKQFLDGTGASGAPGAVNKALTGKQGDDSSQAIIDAARQSVNAQVKQHALANITHAGLGGLGLGAAAAGLGGLMALARKPLRYQQSSNFVAIPYPVKKKEPPLKTAGFLAGDAASTVHSVPWHYPGVVAAGLGGAWAGHSAVKAFLNNRKKNEQKRELADAENQFQQAMLEQYDQPLKVALDNAFDAFNASGKIATLADSLGTGAGLYGTYGLLAGMGGASVGYGLAKKYQRRRVLDQAMKERMKTRFRQQPPEIVAIPTPVERIPQMSASTEKKLVTQPEGV